MSSFSIGQKQKVSLTDEGHSFLIDSKRLLERARGRWWNRCDEYRAARYLRSMSATLYLFYDLLPTTVASFQAIASPPFRSIFSIFRAAINSRDREGARSPSASSDYTSLSKKRGLQFGTDNMV